MTALQYDERGEATRVFAEHRKSVLPEQAATFVDIDDEGDLILSQPRWDVDPDDTTIIVAKQNVPAFIDAVRTAMEGKNTKGAPHGQHEVGSSARRRPHAATRRPKRRRSRSHVHGTAAAAPPNPAGAPADPG
jgi:hypothetical protein